MSRTRFGLLLALLVLVVGATSFVAVLAVIDDDPGVSDAGSTTTLSSTTSTSTTAPGGLDTPTFVAIVSSEGNQADAQVLADELTEQGYDSHVLRSDDYASLEPGFWVAYVGPFPDAPAAQAATTDLVGDGYTAAYVRCVGTAEECA